MCVAAIAWQPDDRWQLVAIGNRDEFYDRPTAPLALWDNGIVAGRDLLAGGTWLGVHGNGRFALVTNRRVEGYPRAELASRGTLVTDWLLSGELPDTAAMNPFNLFVSGASASFHTNYPLPAHTCLSAGVHGLSNGAFDEPWSKTSRLTSALSEWLASKTATPDQLFAALADRTCDGRETSQGPAPDLSSVFIARDHYGTRASTVVLVDWQGNGTITERRFAAGGIPAGETTRAFRWPGRVEVSRSNLPRLA